MAFVLESNLWPTENASVAARILIACNSRGRMLEVCFQFEKIREAIWGIFSDRDCGAFRLAENYGLEGFRTDETNAAGISDRILALCEANDVDYIISTGYTRLFEGAILERYRGRILNTHFSILPAFPGRVSSDWTGRVLPPRDIFGRTLAFGARITGNTVHLVDASIDGGRPVMQSSLALPYDEAPDVSRHRLFVQECQCLMQVILWLNAGRLKIYDGLPRIINARFNDRAFAPALEEHWIENFSPPFLGAAE